MRLYEFADAEAQLGLLRTIIDNTWTAIAQQAEQQKKAEAARKANAKPKPRFKKGSKTAPKIATSPLPILRTPPTAPSPNQQAQIAKGTTPTAVDVENNQPFLHPLTKQQSTSTAISTKSPSNTQPKQLSNAPKNALYGIKQGYFGKDRAAIEKDDDGDDRHSENGSSRTKK